MAGFVISSQSFQVRKVTSHTTFFTVCIFFKTSKTARLTGLFTIRNHRTHCQTPTVPDKLHYQLLNQEGLVEQIGKILKHLYNACHLLMHSLSGADQGLLNTFFSSWATTDMNKHLPFIYNLSSTSVYSYLPAFKA